MVFWVGAQVSDGSVPRLRSPLCGVKHYRAEGYTDQPAPGGVMKVSAPPLSFSQLSEVYLQHPEVSTGEKEERRKTGVLALTQHV